MVHRRSVRFAAALVLCAGIALSAGSAQADIITYSATVPGGEFGPTTPMEYPLGTLEPLPIPTDRIITGATLSGTWLPFTGSYENLAPSEIWTNTAWRVAEISTADVVPLAWSFNVPRSSSGDYEFLRTLPITLSLRALGSGGIGVGPITLAVETVPEPGTVALWSLGGASCLAIGLYRRWRRA